MKLKHRDWVLQLEVVKDLWMEHTDWPNVLSRKVNISTSLREEFGIAIVSVRLQVEIFVQSSSNLGHQLTQSSMNDLEGRLGVQLHDANLSVVNAAGILGWVDFGAIRNLENLLRNSLILVRLENLKKTWDQRSSDLLVLQSFGVGELNSFLQVWLVSQIFIVVFDG